MKKIETIKRDLLEGRLFAAARKRRKKARIRRKKKFDEMLGGLARKYYFSRFEVVPGRIFFVTYNGIYNCNPKYITEEIVRRRLPYEIYWGVSAQQLKNREIDGIPKQVRLVKKNTYEYYKAQATAQVWVDNAVCCVWKTLPKKQNQYYIDTWHGSMGLKSVSKQDITDRQWLKKAIACGEKVDCCISNSAFETRVFRDTYFGNNQIAELGHARNDILFASKENRLKVKEKILKKYGLLRRAQSKNMENIKICLYAPTFRDDKSLAFLDLDYDLLNESLKTRWGGADCEWVLFSRLHYHDRKQQPPQTAGVVNVTSYPDIQELMLAADVGITDYSSWICDFVLTGRPAFIYASDLGAYGRVRGLCYPLSETPFPIAKNNDELAQNILNFDAGLYEGKRLAFLKKMGCCEDGHAAEKAVELIEKITAENTR